MAFKYKITLFTPTYNRAYILETLYRSIQRQTYRDFEWLVVDDGSTDHTEELIHTWMKDGNDFPIRYYKVKNGGKCRAINYALDLAEGELFFIMDSDDYLTDDSLETVVKWEATIAGKPGYCGVAGNRGSSPTETPNTSLMSMYGSNYIDEYAFVRYPEYTDKVVDGERAGVWYTEIHRKYKYPEFEGKSLKVYNGVACIRWGVNKTEMPWEAYDIDPDTLQIFNTDESKRSCLHGSHWTNYLRFNPKRNLEGVKGWTDFYNRQAEMFGGVNAQTLAEAVNQLFYYEFAKLEVCDKEAVIDLSEMNEQKLDCHINEFFISFKKGTEPIACEGGDISLYEEHKEFNTYKIVHDADTVKIALK